MTIPTSEILRSHWYVTLSNSFCQTRNLNCFRLVPGSVKVGNVIATGAYGRVYEGTYGRLKVAIKDYGLIYKNLKEDDETIIMDEFQIMKDLKHTNTTRVYGFILNQGCVALVMEFANKGSLKTMIESKKLKKDVMLKYHILLQIALAMRFIHSKGILHRDLKPDNVLVFQENKSSLVVKISDFGESRVCSFYSITNVMSGLFFFTFRELNVLEDP